MVDADCRLAAGCVDRLARTCAREERPVRALYLIRSPHDAALIPRIAEFA